MFFRASLKPARSVAKETPELEQLGAHMSAALADKYYGETIVSFKFVYCVAAAEATRIGVKRVYDCHFEIGVALEATAATDLRGCLALALAALPRVRAVVRATDDLAVDALLADAAAALPRIEKQLASGATPTIDDWRVRSVRARRAALSKNPRPLTKKVLRGIRVYNSFRRPDPLKALTTFEKSFPLSLIIETHARNATIHTPGYDEIYVQLAATEEIAIATGYSGEHWHEYSYAGLDLAAFNAGDDATKQRLYIDAVESAVLAKAAEDHLDAAPLRAAFASVRKHGPTAELVFRTFEVTGYRIDITFRPRCDGRMNLDFCVVVTRLRDNASASQAIVTITDISEAVMRFASAKLSKQTLHIDARSSFKASLYIGNAPKRISIDLATLFPAPSTNR
jgi:hypothetical protein